MKHIYKYTLQLVVVQVVRICFKLRYTRLVTIWVLSIQMLETVLCIHIFWTETILWKLTILLVYRHCMVDPKRIRNKQPPLPRILSVCLFVFENDSIKSPQLSYVELNQQFLSQQNSTILPTDATSCFRQRLMSPLDTKNTPCAVVIIESQRV